ncbi:MAG: type IV toxin-antitoxin system AbiEi family antitoxin domain-containing protein [Acaryochloris sp. RU_4_1]|nr:type IV toxin-antitoxin system AbiEi family antitoxin domain-containing protein [Acaryochloris sp. RU_4_1]NJR55082.1 type IV toxin-antitoxin system AbiEi family antitoxin domain-containing protein [Acaryochloris sp. CRU_2_0]
MISLMDKIKRRIRAHGRGKWVCTPKDFLDLGNRSAVDQALSRLAKSGILRRIGRGLYDFPRNSRVLNRPAPPNVDAAVNAIVRRDKIQIMPDGIVVANQLGLTNAVPAKTSYMTNGSSRILKVGDRTVQFRHASQRLIDWANRPSAPIVQAMDWMGKHVASAPGMIDTLRMKLSDAMKQDLMKGINLLPSAWMASIVHSLNLDLSVAA